MSGKFIEGIIDAPGHPDFEKVFAAYAKIFTLENEFKSHKKLLEALKRNTDEALQHKAGPCKEMWVYLKTPQGEIAAATNFDVFAGSVSPDIGGTVQGHYTLVDPKFRRMGLLAELLRLRDEKAKLFIREVNPHASPDPHIITFIEQNSPPLMTANQWNEDAAATQTHPVLRRDTFERAGYRQLDMRYIQLPLKKNGDACLFQDLCVKGIEGDSVSADVVRHHLERVLMLSYPEGITLEHPSAAPMKDLLAQRGRMIPLLPPGRFQTFATLAGLSTQLGTALQLPVSQRNTPLGELFSAAAGAFYTPKAIKAVRDILPKAAKRAAREPDVLVIGAGIAGLTAAYFLREEGVTYRIIEAAGEAGGRAKTLLTPSGMPVDTGAHWGHNPEDNPLTHVLDKAGLPYTLDPVETVWSYRGGVNHGRTLRSEANAAINPQKVSHILNGGKDCAFAELIDDPQRRHDFCRVYSTWYGLDKPAHSSGGDRHPSAYEYLTDEGTPGGFQVTGGIGRLVDVLARKARLERNVLFNTPVTRISATQEGVKVRSANGETFAAKKAIVTVPQAVLASGAIVFDPPISEQFQADLANMATGKMDKIILELPRGFLASRGVPKDTHLDLVDADPSLFNHLHSAGQPIITMLVGGSKAKDIKHLSPHQAMEFIHRHLAQVKELEGYRDQVVGNPITTGWCDDPYALSAWSVGLPGIQRTGPRQEGNVYFAGEAFDKRFPASMAGAYVSGGEAARMAAKALKREKWGEFSGPHTSFVTEVGKRRGGDGAVAL